MQIRINKTEHIEKPWGYEEILETNPEYTLKRLFMKKSYQCSYQYHEKKQETVLCLLGDLTILLEGKEVILRAGESITIYPLQKHRMLAKEKDCSYLECSTSELNDVIRIQDDYGREQL